MRIIAGKYRGKKLFTPEGQEVRPTSERAREALFSILYSRLRTLSECKVLDVFAGTGAFGLEALSRGAKNVSFVDKNVQLLNKNVALFPNEKNNISVVLSSALNLPLAKEKYNLVFMDAPYAQNLSAKAIEQLVEKEWLEKDALCLIETSKDEELYLPDFFELCDERYYGVAKISFYIYRK